MYARRVDGNVACPALAPDQSLLKPVSFCFRRGKLGGLGKGQAARRVAGAESILGGLRGPLSYPQHGAKDSGFGLVACTLCQKTTRSDRRSRKGRASTRTALCAVEADDVGAG